MTQTHAAPRTVEEIVKNGWEVVRCPVSDLHVAARVPDGDRIYCLTEERWVGSPLDDLYALDKDDSERVDKAKAALLELSENLKGVSPLELAAAREKAINALEGKIKSPARMVDAALSDRQLNPSSKDQGQVIDRQDLEPWPEFVDGAELLEEIGEYIQRFISFPDRHSLVAVVLWTVHTHLLNAFLISPRLRISSAVPDCGKSVLIETIEPLVYRPLQAANLTEAVLFRLTAQRHPTLLIDEAETSLRPDRNPSLLQVLNAGHRYGGKVWRCEGDANEVVSFMVFGAVAYAGIGKFGSAASRTRDISIRMSRMLPGAELERHRRDKPDETVDLYRRIKRFAADNRDQIKAGDPEVPEELMCRPADNWRPLIGIAEAAGGDWPNRARDSAKALSGQGETDEAETRIQLLSDVHAIFEKRGEKVFTRDILDELHQLEDRPWPEWKGGKPLSEVQLARLLKPFKIKPRQVKVGGVSKKGYRREDLEDAFRRYVPLLEAKPPKPLNSDGRFPESHDETSALPGFGSDTPKSSIATGKVSEVSAQNPVEGWEDI
jgi:hypothetical protein